MSDTEGSTTRAADVLHVMWRDVGQTDAGTGPERADRRRSAKEAPLVMPVIMVILGQLHGVPLDACMVKGKQSVDMGSGRGT